MYARGVGSFDAVAQAIQTVEGYYPGSLAYKNNNPGNLRPAGQPGCVPVNGFCSFATYDQGYQALLNQIALDASRGFSISEFISKYAPASDSNDPTSYAARLASALGLSVSDPLAAADLPGFAATGTDFFVSEFAPAGAADNSWLYAALLAGAALVTYAVIS
jgi:hypothetical protein